MYSRNLHRFSTPFWIAVLLLGAFTSALANNENNPVANPKAVVVAGQARFTVLTPQLIRMEWAENGKFEDNASLLFINRRLPVPVFQSSMDADWLIIETEKLLLKYRKNTGKFTKDNLQISLQLNGRKVTWMPGVEDKGNLRGTTRTLDGVQGATSLEAGLLSRDGWVVIDDSDRPLFDRSDWPWVVERPEGNRQDLYFSGYGHDYKMALYDFTRVAGRIPMPPRFAFGLWWSRYWAFTDREFKDLVREFEIYNVPLDVLVIDMDWHQTFNLRWDRPERDQAGQRLGWTGYTWDKNFFPDPEAFLTWCEEKGLKTPLNLHPASGIQPHEERYREMAAAMGVDPSSKKYIPFDIVDKKFATNFLNIVLRPLEKQGVDFWWLDWQQWGTTKIPGVTPTWWLNYVFFTDMERRAKERPLLYHRWGGLGNHRYEIGFSGDTYSSWASLGFQPYFTATAANVGYGYWSHDIGGHLPGPVSAELYTRWIQFGAFSPILRTHTTKNPNAERRIWAYPTDYFLAMRNTILLRYALIPYIYSAAREAYDTGISFLRPMYYDYPESPEAYDFKDQYMFGDKILVAPIVAPVDSMSLLAEKQVWLPEGSWIEWFTGKRLEGPQVVKRSFTLDEIPAYVKAGSILPMQPNMSHTGEKAVDPLILNIVPGDSGSVQIYEDQGNSLGYQTGEFAWTRVRQTSGKDGTMKIEILPVEGSYPGILDQRGYEIRLVNAWPPTSVTCSRREISYSSNQTSPGWWYDGDQVAAFISIPRLKVNEKVEIVVKTLPALQSKVALLDGVRGKLSRLRTAMQLVNNTWPEDWSPDILVEAAQTGNRISLHPQQAMSELESLYRLLSKLPQSIEMMKGDKKFIRQALNHLRDAIK